MEDANPACRPFVLWFDTLPNGSTAKVYVYPRQDKPAAILHRNDCVHSVYEFDTREEAIERGWELHQQLLDEAVDQLSDESSALGRPGRIRAFFEKL